MRSKCARTSPALRYGDLKKQVAEMVVAAVEPLQQRYREIAAEPGLRGRYPAPGRRARGPHRQFDRRAGQAAHGPVRALLIWRSPFPLTGAWFARRNFRRLWLAQVISEMGDWIYCVAIYTLLLELTHSAKSVAFAFVLQVLPQSFVAPLAGVVNDRVSRRRVMIAADLARSVIVLGKLVASRARAVPLIYLLLLLETVMWASSSRDAPPPFQHRRQRRPADRQRALLHDLEPQSGAGRGLGRRSCRILRAQHGFRSGFALFPGLRGAAARHALSPSPT